MITFLEVPSNWTGTVTPSLAGFTFSPEFSEYTNLSANQTGQNYVATAILYTISGNTGVGGVTLSWEDVAPAPIANKTKGEVKAEETRSAKLNSTDIRNQKISENNKELKNAPAAPMIVKTAVSDVNGDYSFTVSYNWSGTVTPSLAGYTFTPANNVYTNVLADQPNQNYAAEPILYTISGNAGIAGAVMNWI